MTMLVYGSTICMGLHTDSGPVQSQQRGSLCCSSRAIQAQDYGVPRVHCWSACCGGEIRYVGGRSSLVAESRRLCHGRKPGAPVLGHSLCPLTLINSPRERNMRQTLWRATFIRDNKWAALNTDEGGILTPPSPARISHGQVEIPMVGFPTTFRSNPGSRIDLRRPSIIPFSLTFKSASESLVHTLDVHPSSLG